MISDVEVVGEHLLGRLALVGLRLDRFWWAIFVNHFSALILSDLADTVEGRGQTTTEQQSPNIINIFSLIPGLK